MTFLNIMMAMNGGIGLANLANGSPFIGFLKKIK